jgi:hypothetical protein
LHDLMTLNQKVFCLVGPYLVRKLWRMILKSSLNIFKLNNFLYFS